MVLEKVLFALQAQSESGERSRELAHMGYMQWLGGLPGWRSYPAEAAQALQTAGPFRDSDPAVDAFCRLLERSIVAPLTLLEVALPKPGRRGGAKARRRAL